MTTARYTHGHGAAVLRSHRWRTAENSVGYLLGALQPDMRILDVGCGPGTITLDLAELVTDGRVTALEPAAAALDEARAGAEARGLTNVDFVEATLERADLAEASYDVVHTHQVLHHVSDPVGMLAEMRRLCRPGGLVAARESDFGAFTYWPDLPGLAAWNELFHRITRRNGGEPDAGRRLLSWARAAGLAEITSTASVWCFSTPDDRAWWGGSWADRVTGRAFTEQALAAGASAADLAAIADAWREWAAAEDGWFLVPHGEVLARV
jgi:2-polyprenyl-3-methyl-5-hydroxy-6-metoxy-1,4-benzoquinol methylase